MKTLPASQEQHILYLNILKNRFEEKYNERINSKKSIKDYDIIKIIGSGGYADVFLVRDKENMQYNALKVIDKQAVVLKNHQKHILTEKKILAAIDFIFVANMVLAFMDNSNLYFLLPFVGGGDLYNLLQKHGQFSYETARFYLCQLVLALEYLHHCGIVHRDIKPENVLMDQSGYIKLCDFGFAKRMDSTKTWTLCGTPDYLAPELIMSKGYGFSVDWWAIGIMTFEMLSGATPFYASDPTKLYQKILDGNYKCPDFFNAESKSIIKGLLAPDPARRLGCLKGAAADIKIHSFFQNVDWTSILNTKETPPIVPTTSSPGDTRHFPDIPDVKLKTAANDLYQKEFADF